MNNKGFTLVEVLITLVLISILTLIAGAMINSSLKASKEESYEMMKQNIITASQSYINECNSKIIDCDITDVYSNGFYAKKLIEYGYLKKLKSPIDGKNIGDCILVKFKNDNGIISINLEDTCY